jgi:hypothetical protein
MIVDGDTRDSSGDLHETHFDARLQVVELQAKQLEDMAVVPFTTGESDPMLGLQQRQSRVLESDPAIGLQQRQSRILESVVNHLLRCTVADPDKGVRKLVLDDMQRTASLDPYLADAQWCARPHREGDEKIERGDGGRPPTKACASW